MYSRAQFDSLIFGMPACIRAVVVSAMMVSDIKLVLSYPLILHTSHYVHSILSNL